MTFMQERRGQASNGKADVLSTALSPCGTQRTITVGNHSLNLPAPHQAEQGVSYQITKRAVDVAVSATLLVLLFPVFAVIALLILLEDRGTIFYCQTRVGRNGKHFTFYKFRSMIHNADQIKAQLESMNEAEGPIFKMRHDPRITRVGRFLRRSSLDELPQLFNVLRGDMSLVGPRPHLPKEVAMYNDEQEARLQVQPGLLCFREVLGRSNMTFEQWVELDLLYIEHRCWQTDLAIMARAVPAVLSAEGAY
jgi:lipopolysaccharide/colanic/teichoic acid biosynthesis glycosyltransferase